MYIYIVIEQMYLYRNWADYLYCNWADVLIL